VGLTNAYLVTTKNLESFLNSLKTAKAPERFNSRFLQQLDFASSNDRLFIGLLKSLGFIDESGVPTKRYYQFLDQSQSGRVLAEALREAYEDLFAVNIRANEMSGDEIKNKLRTLTMGQKSDNVLTLMANTFRALSDLAEWDAPVVPEIVAPPVAEPLDIPVPDPVKVIPEQRSNGQSKLQLHYNIQIHLPESRDPAVFDAIFQALKKHIG
jgi:Family of unknown function (DUF5343)